MDIRTLDFYNNPLQSITLHLPEACQRDLVPAYKVGYSVIYRYNDKFWRHHSTQNLSLFLSDIQQGVGPYMAAYRACGNTSWLDRLLKVGDELFEEVAEPYYYIDPTGRHPRDMVKVSVDWAVRAKKIINWRHYRPNERDQALESAEAVCKAVYGAIDEPLFPPAFIEILDSSLSAQGVTPCNTKNAPSVFDSICAELPRNPSEADRFWSDGNMVFCDTEERANMLADLLDEMGFTGVTGFYDPDEDVPPDELTGWHYVDVG